MCTDGTKHIYDAMGHIFSEVKYNSYSKSYIFNASKGKQQKKYTLNIENSKLYVFPGNF